MSDRYRALAHCALDALADYQLSRPVMSLNTPMNTASIPSQPQSDDSTVMTMHEMNTLDRFSYVAHPSGLDGAPSDLALMNAVIEDLISRGDSGQVLLSNTATTAKMLQSVKYEQLRLVHVSPQLDAHASKHQGSGFILVVQRIGKTLCRRIMYHSATAGIPAMFEALLQNSVLLPDIHLATMLPTVVREIRLN